MILDEAGRFVKRVLDLGGDSKLSSDPFQVQESGIYHLGLHVGGERTHFYIYLTALDVTETPTAIHHAQNGAAAISQHGGEIYIRTSGAEHVQVVALDGRLLHQGKSAETRIQLAPGVYVVKAGDTVQKVWVK